MSLWFEQRPGSEETLLALYDAVAAAEELDLVHQAQDETHVAEILQFVDWLSDDTDAPCSVDDDGSDRDAERVTMTQAVGVIEHLLGGRPLRGGKPAAS